MSMNYELCLKIQKQFKMQTKVYSTTLYNAKCHDKLMYTYNFLKVFLVALVSTNLFRRNYQNLIFHGYQRELQNTYEDKVQIENEEYQLLYHQLLGLQLLLRIRAEKNQLDKELSVPFLVYNLNVLQQILYNNVLNIYFKFRSFFA